jgi:hypothetical protein
VAEQLQIASGDHGGLTFDQADDRIAQRGGLPMLGGNLIYAIKCYRDLAIDRRPLCAAGPAG